jgi:ABC-2 type transport system ATP-binding protein
LINVENLCYSWGRHTLFAQLSISSEGKGVIGLFGRNGSGKSSLLRILAGLLAPHSGSISVMGFEPRRRQASFLAGTYLLPEEFHLPDLTTHTLARTHAPFYPLFDSALFEQYLIALEVPEDQRFSQMSLGQKKKAAIALALATRTPLLLMDEPTNGLDIASRATFKRLLSEEVQRERLVIISTHQAHDLETLMDQIWFMDGGRIVLSAGMSALAHALEVGTSVSASDVPKDRLIYQEPLGGQFVWLARRHPVNAPPSPPDPVPMELLYKALSHNKAGVLSAMAPTVSPGTPS